MKYGMNMLLWTSDVTEEHYPLLENLKSWGYDGVELPIFEMDKAKFTKLGKKLDAVGLGRMVLSYPNLPQDTLQRGQTERKRVCRTFSDCTTAPRHHLVSGCFPLDEYYKRMSEAEQLRQIKQRLSG